MARVKMRTALTLLVALLASPMGLYAQGSELYQEGDWGYSLDDNNSVVLKRYVGTDTEVTTPETLGGHPVVEIGEDCFQGKQSITSITITSGIVKIGENAFGGCYSLTNISFPITILEIGRSAFSACTALTSVTLPERIGKIEGQLFDGCTNLNSVTIPNNVTSIGNNAFRDCTKLESVTIGNNVTSIGYEAFCKCTNLKSITLPNSVTTIDDYAFQQSGLTDVYYAGTMAQWKKVKKNESLVFLEISPAPTIHWLCTATFDTGGKGSTPESQTLWSGNTVTEPEVQFVGEAGQEEGIEGWYTDADHTQVYDFSTPVDHTMTLYAKWVAAGHATINVTNAEGGTCTLTDAKGRTFAAGLIIPGIHTLTLEPVSGHSFSGSYKKTIRDTGLLVSETTIAGSNKKTYSINLTENDLEVNIAFSTRNVLSIDIATDGTATAGTYTIENGMGQPFTHGSILEKVADEASPWDPRYDLVLTISKGENVGCVVSIVNNGQTTTNITDYGTYSITPYGSLDIELFFYDKTSGVLTLLDDDSTQPTGSRNADLLSAADGKRRMVQLSGRTLYRDGGWNTICLPFDLKIEGSPLNLRDVEARTLSVTSIEGNTLTLTFSDPVTILEAGKPYIIKWRKANSNIVNPTFGGVTIKNEVHPVEQTAIDFVGSFSPVIIEGEDRTKLYLGDDNTLYYPTADVTINACRAYFQLYGLTVGDISSEVNTFVLNFGDDDENASGIVDIDHSPLTIDHEVDAWYTIDGRKLSGKPTQKGIYIHNGKKIVIK